MLKIMQSESKSSAVTKDFPFSMRLRCAGVISSFSDSSSCVRLFNFLKCLKFSPKISLHVTFKIQTEGDYENFISSKVIEACKQNGFIPVANNAQSLLRIVINSNQKTADEITSIFPEISIILSDNKKDEIYFTYQNSWGKTSSFSLPQAQKKAFPTIAEELKKELAVKIEEAF